MGLKGPNVSAFMEPDHRKLLLALFTALHPFDQESFALHPSLPPPSCISPFFCLLHSPLPSFLHPHPGPFVMGYECTLLVDNYTLLLCPSLSFPTVGSTGSPYSSSNLPVLLIH